MRFPPPLLLLLPCLALACSAPNDDRHDPVAAAQRVLAIDFAAPVLGRRLDNLQRAPAALAGEFRRAGALRDGLPNPRPELARTAAARDRAVAMLGDEAGRTPSLPVPADELPARWSQDFVDALATLPYALGLHRRPLGELSDRQHRTDPFDTRAETELWRRLARRLLLVR